MGEISVLGYGGSLARCRLPGQSFEQGMYWRLFNSAGYEDLQAPPLLQQLYPMCIICVHCADWRHHLQFHNFNLS